MSMALGHNFVQAVGHKLWVQGNNKDYSMNKDSTHVSVTSDLLIRDEQKYI